MLCTLNRTYLLVVLTEHKKCCGDFQPPVSAFDLLCSNVLLVGLFSAHQLAWGWRLRFTGDIIWVKRWGVGLKEGQREEPITVTDRLRMNETKAFRFGFYSESSNELFRVWMIKMYCLLGMCQWYELLKLKNETGISMWSLSSAL